MRDKLNLTDKQYQALRERLSKLHLMLGSENVNERETARIKLDELLAKHKLTWNDLPQLLITPAPPASDNDVPDDDGGVHPSPLDLIRFILEKHLYLTEHQFTAMTLWVAHTFVFHQFSITPRLALGSPVRGCGKSTALNVIKALGYKTRKLDHTTAAVTFRLIDRHRGTLLQDEGDNLDLKNNPVLRAVINSGHSVDGTVPRYLDGQVVEFSTFAPLALAFIGREIPFPILARCVVIAMVRNPGVKLTRFDMKIKEQKADCDLVHRETFAWARRVQLDPDPEMPERLQNRAADNWRVLLSIADACSGWGELARQAAVALSGIQDEDPGVLLLSDIRDIFDRQPAIDRLASATIVAELIELPHGLWSEWRGSRGDQTPRRLTQPGLARMLDPFGIRPRSIWPPQRGPGDKSSKGYFRADFEAAWASYCAGVPAQRHSDGKVAYFKRTER